MTGTKSNSDENCQDFVNFQYVREHETCSKITNLLLYPPCPPFSFLQRTFVSTHCCEAKGTAKTGLKCICFTFTARNSSRSEDSLFGQATGMASDMSEEFFITSHRGFSVSHYTKY